MSRLRLHRENHFIGRIGWLRAAVLGANDGIISTASLIVGVASAARSRAPDRVFHWRTDEATHYSHGNPWKTPLQQVSQSTTGSEGVSGAACGNLCPIWESPAR